MTSSASGWVVTAVKSVDTIYISLYCVVSLKKIISKSANLQFQSVRTSFDSLTAFGTEFVPSFQTFGAFKLLLFFKTLLAIA